jgi:hypothetical protein
MIYEVIIFDKCLEVLKAWKYLRITMVSKHKLNFILTINVFIIVRIIWFMN